MHATFFVTGSMPSDLAVKGTAFLRRRFLETWRINRADITSDIITGRDNIVMYDEEKIAGWLGIEESGELTNASVEKGYAWRSALSPLITQALELDLSHSAFAFVPVEKLASAYIFLHSGMTLPVDDQAFVKALCYPERTILLVKLVRGGLTPIDSTAKLESIFKLRSLQHELAKRAMGGIKTLGC